MSGVVEERRGARTGTVSGLALLAGGTAVAAVAGGAHSVFATVLLGMLATGMGHALLEETRRQARRRSAGGWARQDTVNAALLAAWSAGALTATILAAASPQVRAVGAGLTIGYAAICGHFVVERCRSIEGTATIIGGTGSVPGGVATSGNTTQSSPTASGPSSATPSTGSPSATVTANTEVIPDGYGASNR
jgi:hypothetical protein